MKRICTLLSLCIIVASVASAQRMITEDFNYTTGTLTSVSGGAWTHFSGNTKPITVVSGSLTYTGYYTNPDTNSGKVFLDTAKLNGEDAYIRFPKTDTGTIYCSFLLDVLTVKNIVAHNATLGEYFIAFLPNHNNVTPAAGVAIRRGDAKGTFNLGIFARPNDTLGITWAPGDYSPNTTVLVTTAYQFVAGDSNNIASLWINPDTNSGQPPADAQAIDIDTKGDPPSLGKLALYQRSLYSPLCYVDAIKVSSSWDDAILPIKLLSFNVIDNNGHASLSWQTCEEVNMQEFQVEKSTDARTFTSIATVAAKNGPCGTTYTYYDAKELAGTAYYRLKMVDKDGHISYSAIVSVNGKLPTKITAVPNPVQNYLVLSHPKADVNATIKIISLNGVVAASYSVQKDAVETSIDVSKLSSGNYIIVFHSGQQYLSTKILKQ